MSKTISEYSKLIDNKKSELSLLKKQKEEKQRIIINKKIYSEQLTKARWILSETTKQTQKYFKEYVENLVTMGINSVFQDRNFKFLMEFEVKRNKSECVLRVQENEDEPFIPKEEMGGSIVDVISFILRIVLWSLKKDRTRNIMVLDEPFRCVGELVQLSGEMVNKISSKLGLQVLMITHDNNLMEVSDRNYTIKHEGGISNVYQS